MPQIKAVIGADTKAYNREMAKARKGVYDLQSAMKTAGTAIASYFAADMLLDFGKALLDTSVKIEQVAMKSSIVFGAFNQQVSDAAAESANKIGLTGTEFKNAAVSIADLLIPMGFTRKEATGMSVDLVKLSGALSSWSAGLYDSAQVSEILAKAMLGEREQLKSLGISITENDVKAQLAKQNQDKLTGAALEQAKALATLELILNKSKDAQAAFASGVETTAMKLAKNRAVYKEFGETLSGLVEPIVGGLNSAFEGIQNFVAKGITVSTIKNPYLGKDNAELQGMLKTYMALTKLYANDKAMFGYHEQYRIAVNLINQALAQQTVKTKKVITNDDVEKDKKKTLTTGLQKYHGVLGDINYELEQLNAKQQNAGSDAELMRINGRIQALQQQKKLYEEIGLITRLEPKQGMVIGSKTLPTPTGNTSISLGSGELSSFEKFRTNLSTIQDYSSEVNSAMQQSFAQTAVLVGESLGSIFTGDFNASTFFDNLMTIVAEFMNSFGQALIASAAAAIAFEELLLTPWQALAAGIALVAASTAVKNILSSGPGGDGSVQKFADGGVIFGPTLGLMGEYAGASRNPEVVAPLSTLAGMLGGTGTEVYGQLYGNDILISNERTGVLRKRMRGR